MLSRKLLCNFYKGKCTPTCQKVLLSLLTQRATTVNPHHSRQYVTNLQRNLPSKCQQRNLFYYWLVQRNKLQYVTLRQMSSEADMARRNTSGLIYVCAIGVFMVGMTYAGVPLYRMFCQVNRYTNIVHNLNSWQMAAPARAHPNTILQIFFSTLTLRPELYYSLLLL